MYMFSIYITPSIVFALTIVFGLWLSNTGRPYNGILFNIHKLAALGVVVILIVQLTKMLENAESLALIVALLISAGLSVVALFTSGALMSMGKLNYALMLNIHRIAPVGMAITIALVIYLLARKV